MWHQKRLLSQKQIESGILRREGGGGGDHPSTYLKYMIDTTLEHLTQTYNPDSFEKNI